MQNCWSTLNLQQMISSKLAFFVKDFDFSAPSETCICLPSSALPLLPGKTYCSKICNTLLHSFLYGHMFEIIFSLNLSAYLLLWHLTCNVTSQAMPTDPSVSLADATIMRSQLTSLEQSLGSHLNIPYCIYILLQYILKVQRDEWPCHPSALLLCVQLSTFFPLPPTWPWRTSLDFFVSEADDLPLAVLGLGSFNHDLALMIHLHRITD